MATQTLINRTASASNAIGGIVRRFSHHMIEDHPNDRLAVALVDQEVKDEEAEERERRLDQQWKSLFIPGAVQQFETEEEGRLDASSQELAKAWEKFQKYVPKEHRSRYTDRPPNIEDVANAVASANLAWKEKQHTKTGKTKTLFANVCETLHDYKNVMAPIPSQDKYFSLLTGSFSVVVTATINHKKMAEGVSSCLESLGDDIAYWKRQLEIHNDNGFMKRYVAQLYVLVFQLLVDIMHWFKSGIKRFSGSFDEAGFDKLVKGKTDKMQALALKLENEGKLATEAKIRTTEDDVKALLARPEQPNAEELVARFLAEIDKRLDKHEQKVGKVVQRALRDEAKSLAWSFQNRRTGSGTNRKQIEDGRPALQVLPSGHQLITKDHLQANALRLQKYQQKDVLARLVHRSRDMDINVEVLRKIRVLLTHSAVSQSLWICGPFQVAIPSRMSLTAASLCSAAEKAGIATLVYFCEREDLDSSTKSTTGEAKGVSRFVLSLIAQLVDLISTDTVDTGVDLSTTRFASLDGSIDSLPAAVSLLEDLLIIRPKLLFCFFDGLQLLHRNLTKVETKAIGDVIRMLRNSDNTPSSVDKGVINVLYTTDGFFEVLGVLRGNERLTLSDFDSEDRIGRGVDVTEL